MIISVLSVRGFSVVDYRRADCLFFPADCSLIVSNVSRSSYFSFFPLLSSQPDVLFCHSDEKDILSVSVWERLTDIFSVCFCLLSFSSILLLPLSPPLLSSIQITPCLQLSACLPSQFCCFYFSSHRRAVFTNFALSSLFLSLPQSIFH